MMDPLEILGVREGASEDELRSAYLAKVKEHPPDRSPEQFERIRDAYETLRSPRRRIEALLDAQPQAPLVSLLEKHVPGRRFAGSRVWLEVLKGK